MRILALECSVTPGSVAVLDCDNVLVAQSLDVDRRTTCALTPAIASLLAEVSWRPGDVELVAVATGPGSFTGLRVGVTSAKTFAYATGCEVLGVSALRVIAEQCIRELGPADRVREFHAVMDAQRGQLFLERFPISECDVVAYDSVSIVDQSSWLAELRSDIAVGGPVLGKLSSRLPKSCRVTNAEEWSPRAETVGRLTYRDFSTGRRGHVWTLAPDYYRRSAAEEKLADREVIRPANPRHDV